MPRFARFLTAVALAVLPVVSSVAAEPTPTPVFRAVTIDDEISIGYGLAIADIDGDGRSDIVLADKQQIVWYRNPAWTKHLMAERLTELDNVCVAAMDIDGDGRAEVAAGAGWNPGDTIGSGALFYLQPPADRTQRWEPIRLAHDPTIHRIRWVRNVSGGFDLASVPLHGRGNRNGEGDGVRILAYHPPADPAAPWTTTLLNDRWHATHNVQTFQAGQAPGDGLAIAAKEGVFLLTPRTGGWGVSTVATNGPSMPGFRGAGEVRVGSAGGRMAFVATIEIMHGNQVVIYQPARDGGPDGGPWGRQVIDESILDGHGLAVADFLGTGRDQVVAGWRAMNRPGSRVGIRFYQPSGAEQTDVWTPHLIDDNAMACEDLQAADLDGDGDPDLVASGRATRNVKIYFNERPARR